jgi:hypothetical protein
MGVAAAAKSRKRLTTKVALRMAIQSGDNAAVLAEITNHVSVDENGCWIWSGTKSVTGYPVLRTAHRRDERRVHRVVLEAKHGKPLGSQQAHHVCAVRACVNPDHLQPVTHAENVAEMHSRRALVERIRELESALRQEKPDHQLLQVIEVGAM